MRKIIFGSFMILAQTFLSASASEVVGYYSNGSIKDSLDYQREVPFIHKLFKARKRLYSSEEMFQVIKDMDNFIASQNGEKETIQLGDLSHQKGGKATGHGSHQNGLDADFVYLTNNRKLQSINAGYWEEEFVNNNKLTANFDLKRNIELFNFLSNKTPTARIFVDEVVKKEICRYLTVTGERNQVSMQNMLRKLRVENLHKTHFHLRLYCPVGDSNCTPQSEPPKGDGCDLFQMNVLDKSFKEKSC